MPLIETKGAASAQGFGGAGAGASGPVTYIEDVFSTYLYTGNGSTQTITNGIDLSGKGGLVWLKSRSASGNNMLYDTARGTNRFLISSATSGQFNQGSGNGLTSFLQDGFSLNNFDDTNPLGTTCASWTFREQPKFFDVVTWTGDGANRTIAHNLGSVPGCIIVKRTDSAADWQVYHRSLANTEYLVLNTTAAKATGTTRWNSTTPTSTVFSLGTDTTVNANGGTYVAYLFAHDAGGFGLSGTDNVISCGSFTTDGSGNATIDLGYEPQWVMTKRTDSTSQWFIQDTMRGFTANATSSVRNLYPNLTNAEATASGIGITSTGFVAQGQVGSNATWIYIAIRRGPMKTPTTGTSVFSPNTSAALSGTISTGFPVDLSINSGRVGINDHYAMDRLRGDNTNYYNYLVTDTTAAEVSGTGNGLGFDNNTGFVNNWAGASYIWWNFRRAPGFFDVVCYTGTGASSQTISHNLVVVPELIIFKNRTTGGPGQSWWTYCAALTNPLNKYGALESSNAFTDVGSAVWTAPTATTITAISGFSLTNSSNNYVAYLFATCAGVSKVGSYTGTGALQTINCGFTGGARFVLIKRTDSTGDWYVYDSARGISSGNDPYLLLNSTAAEVTGTNYVDTTSVGFQVTAAAPAGLNANGGTYIFLAIA